MKTPGSCKWLLACILFAALLSGCSSMSEAECKAVDWQTIGYEDGVNGYSGSHIGQHREACGKYGVTPNLAQYQLGREQGLREFCKPANGFRFGARGNTYGGVCPADMDRQFSAAYDSGRTLYQLRSQVSNTANRLDSMRHEMNRIDERLIKVGADILDPKINQEQRAQLVLDTKQLAERRGSIKNEIPKLESDLAYYQNELDKYRATLAYVE